MARHYEELLVVIAQSRLLLRTRPGKSNLLLLGNDNIITSCRVQEQQEQQTKQIYVEQGTRTFAVRPPDFSTKRHIRVVPIEKLLHEESGSTNWNRTSHSTAHTR